MSEKLRKARLRARKHERKIKQAFKTVKQCPDCDTVMVCFITIQGPRWFCPKCHLKISEKGVEKHHRMPNGKLVTMDKF